MSAYLLLKRLFKTVRAHLSTRAPDDRMYRLLALQHRDITPYASHCHYHYLVSPYGRIDKTIEALQRVIRCYDLDRVLPESLIRVEGLTLSVYEFFLDEQGYCLDVAQVKTQLANLCELFFRYYERRQTPAQIRNHERLTHVARMLDALITELIAL